MLVSILMNMVRKAIVVLKAQSNIGWCQNHKPTYLRRVVLKAPSSIAQKGGSLLIAQKTACNGKYSYILTLNMHSSDDYGR